MNAFSAPPTLRTTHKLKTLVRGALAFALLGAALLCSNWATRVGLSVSIGDDHGHGVAMLLLVQAAALIGVAWLHTPPHKTARWIDVLLATVLGAAGASGMLRHPALFTGAALLPYAVLGGAYLLVRLRVCETRWPVLLTLAGTGVAISVLLESFGLLGNSQQPPGGILGNRNFAGQAIAAMLPAAIVAIRKPRWAAVVVLWSAALVLTRSRTAWIACTPALLALLLTKNTLRTRLATLGALAAGAVAVTALPTQLQWQQNDPYVTSARNILDLQTGSGGLRVQQHQRTSDVLSSANSWPLGLGPGAWQGAMRDAGHETLAINPIPSSDWVRIAADIGLVGLVPFVAVLCLGIGLSLARHGWTAAVLLAIAVVATGDALLFRPEGACLAGLALASIRRQSGMMSTDV